MTKDLATINNDSELNAVLHGIAQGGDRPESLPLIKFDAVNGVFMMWTGEKGDDGFPIFNEIGETLVFHMVTSRKQYIQKDSSGIYSREFNGFKAELINQSGDVIFSGSMKDIKSHHGADVKYCSNLYGLAKLEGDEASMAKLRITGSMCGPWFNIMGTFNRENPISRNVLRFERGARMRGHDGADATIATPEEIAKYDGELKAGRKPKDNLFYMISIKPIIKLENAQVIQNVQMVIDYLQLVIDYLQSREEDIDALEEKVEKVEAEIIPSEKRTISPEPQKMAGIPENVEDIFPGSEISTNKSDKF